MASKVTGPCVILSGGPCSGWVYYVADWQRREDADRRFGRPARYAKTDRVVSVGDVVSTSDRAIGAIVAEVWEWRAAA